MEKSIATERMPHSKRYRLIFSIWCNLAYKSHDSVTDYDSYEDLMEETKLLREYYNNTPRPKKVSGNVRYGFTYDFSEGRRFWGYISVDYEKEEILEVYKDGARIYISNSSGILEPIIPGSRLHIKDLLFRGESEIPKNYKWDDGEYSGWLQFRWGDGSNAIESVKQRKILGGSTRAEAIIEDPMEEYNKEIEKETIQRKLDRW